MPSNIVPISLVTFSVLYFAGHIAVAMISRGWPL